MSNLSEKFFKDFASLTPSALIELYVLDATDLGGERFYFYDGTGVASRPELPNPPVQFQGIVYQPMPIKVSGFEFSTKGELPRPTITFSNVLGEFTALTLLFDDLVGAKLVRKRTLRKFLDDGTDPSPSAELPEDIYFVDRKSSETKNVVEFELGTILDVEGLKLPRRQVLSNICSWQYRGAECAFAQNRFVSDSNGIAYPLNNNLVMYTGLYSASRTYNRGECCSKIVGAEEHFYKLSATTSKGVDPSTSANWQRVQRYRGLWKAVTTTGVPITYYANDVVYIMSKGARQYFILVVAQSSGYSSEPPNTDLWKADQCGKLMTHCKLRQDSLALNLPLTFGAFPGTSKVPSIS